MGFFSITSKGSHLKLLVNFNHGPGYQMTWKHMLKNKIFPGDKMLRAADQVLKLTHISRTQAILKLPVYNARLNLFADMKKTATKLAYNQTHQENIFALMLSTFMNRDHWANITIIRQPIA